MHAVAGAVDNTLYVCGGRRGWSRLRSCLTLKKGQTEWGRDTNLSESRVAATSAVVGGKLYVAGGATSDRDISAFDPRTGRWSRVADLGRASGYKQATMCLNDGLTEICFTLCGFQVRGRPAFRDRIRRGPGQELQEVLRRGVRPCEVRRRRRPRKHERVAIGCAQKAARLELCTSG